MSDDNAMAGNEARKDRGWSPLRTTLTFVGLLAFTLAVYAVWYFVHVTAWGPKYGNAGAFGDAFAPVAGLLSSLTLAAAVLSVFMQRRELELQRQDLEETREVFRAQEESQRALAKVQGESLENAKALVKALEALAKVTNLDANTSDAQYEFEQQRFKWDEWSAQRQHERELLSVQVAALNARIAALALQAEVRGGPKSTKEDARVLMVAASELYESAVDWFAIQEPPAPSVHTRKQNDD